MQPIEDHHVSFILGQGFSAFPFDIADGQRQILAGSLFDHAQHSRVGCLMVEDQGAGRRRYQARRG